MSRLYGKILKDLIEQEYSSYKDEKQSGFRAGSSPVHAAGIKNIIANDREDIEYMVRKAIEEFYTWGLVVNSEKN
ncbi:hypothetical protein ILUMI_26668 [Ignelater luminosus]|uniref:Uncharacterized protein n=1 Tax=Ignelater luminosus TaxID=2038154 RepID=A0A8K0C5H3_IGNLU|nr:hypothetical protein ILUMI_26668 [Ignelater luminosus]